MISMRRLRWSFAALAALVFVLAASPQVFASVDQAIKQSIEDAAARSPRLQNANVQIAVEDSSVVLFGTVQLYLHRLDYERIAWQADGVVEVDNEIRVVPQAGLADAAIERKIWELVKVNERFHASNFKIAVENGDVLLDATFLHPRDVLFLRRSVAAIEGVISISIAVSFAV